MVHQNDNILIPPHVQFRVVFGYAAFGFRFAGVVFAALDFCFALCALLCVRSCVALRFVFVCSGQDKVTAVIVHGLPCMYHPASTAGVPILEIFLKIPLRHEYSISQRMRASFSLVLAAVDPPAGCRSSRA